MQDPLFPDEHEGDLPAALHPVKTAPRVKAGSAKAASSVSPQPPDATHIELATALPALARLGTSSWNYPG